MHRLSQSTRTVVLLSNIQVQYRFNMCVCTGATRTLDEQCKQHCVHKGGGGATSSENDITRVLSKCLHSVIRRHHTCVETIKCCCCSNLIMGDIRCRWTTTTMKGHQQTPASSSSHLRCELEDKLEKSVVLLVMDGPRKYEHIIHCCLSEWGGV